MTTTRLNKIVPWHVRASWGLSSVEEKADGISFQVSGKKYTGTVSIKETSSRHYLVNISGKQFESTDKELRYRLDKEIEN